VATDAKNWERFYLREIGREALYHQVWWLQWHGKYFIRTEHKMMKLQAPCSYLSGW
jgi:hypothetical protein